MKVDERLAARRMRADRGLAMREIAERLGVAVSSVSQWTRDIELTASQLEGLRSSNRLVMAQRAGSEANRRAARLQRLNAQEHGRTLARRGDPLHLAGCMLFWAEGSKTRNSVDFTNSDPEMMVKFLHFLRSCYGVCDERVRLDLNCYLGNGLGLVEIEDWWLNALQLPRKCLRSRRLNANSRASKLKRRTLPYGTARLSVGSTFVVQSIYGAIQEYAGINRPEWLD
jgi:transposase-like protein